MVTRSYLIGRRAKAGWLRLLVKQGAMPALIRATTQFENMAHSLAEAARRKPHSMALRAFGVGFTIALLRHRSKKYG